ncbi:MAG: zinc-ribbon domain-containing protein [Verrucomicrobia bacterium]|jgi:DNA-directed RNA polymerase subunit M/transcription elongation factor TFIIS|nr:zinc-ribbon domain-containing protein [Verrucomicrobiota bacterium]
MADIEFNCPECGQVLEAPEEMAGEAIACPACEATITIPGPEPEETLVLPNLPNVSIPSVPPEPEKNGCPECQAELADGAVLCVHCGYHLKLGKKISTEFD